MNEPYHIKAIETVYDGHKFRSRLEARWAVFFKALNIPYEYEKEGFELPLTGRYLPDFWLPNHRCWIEIKGECPTDLEIIKAIELAKFSQSKVYIFYGQIDLRRQSAFILNPDYNFKKFFDKDGSWDFTYDAIFNWTEYLWCECSQCKYIGIGAAKLITYKMMPNEEMEEIYEIKLNCRCANNGLFSNPDHKSQIIIDAYAKARKAQFEFNKKA